MPVHQPIPNLGLFETCDFESKFRARIPIPPPPESKILEANFAIQKSIPDAIQEPRSPMSKLQNPKTIDFETNIKFDWLHVEMQTSISPIQNQARKHLPADANMQLG